MQPTNDLDVLRALSQEIGTLKVNEVLLEIENQRLQNMLQTNQVALAEMEKQLAAVIAQRDELDEQLKRKLESEGVRVAPRRTRRTQVNNGTDTTQG